MIALQTFNDDIVEKITFPSHICIYGKTMSGKSHLAAEIIANIDEIYTRKTQDCILVILSPHANIENVLQERIGTEWTIIHFQVVHFSQIVIDNMLSFLLEQKLLGMEIVTLFDDLIIQASASSTVHLFLVKTFAILRHQNITLIATVQNNSPTVMEILHNCTLIYIMQSFGSLAMITRVLRTFLGLINVPSLLRKIYPLLENDNKGSFILINLSHEANINNQFTLSNSITQDVGFTKRYLEIISLQQK